MWGAATRVFIRMRHFFKTRVIKRRELLGTLQYLLKTFCQRSLNKSITTFLLIVKIPFFENFHLLRKSFTKLKLIYRGYCRYTAISISLTTKSQR